MIARNRSGSTLPELLVVLVVMSVIGAGMMGVLVTQSRFFNDQEGQANARRVARNGTTLVLADLRMVEADSGVVAATPTSFTIRVPYWAGVVCGSAAGSIVAAMQPVDSVMLAEAGYSGYAFVDSTFTINYIDPGGALGAGSVAVCNASSVDTVPRGRVISIAGTPAGANPGSPLFLFQRVSYAFLNSVTVPGKLGLFRTVVGRGLTEEVAAPFDASAGFSYFTTGGGAPIPSPGTLSSIRGIELQLTGLNERNVTQGKTQQAPLLTAVFFENR